MSDERDPADVDRDAILARRARFVATAMAGLSIAAGCEACEPQPCLNIAIPQTARPEAGDDALAGDAGVKDAGAATDAGATDGGVNEAGVRP